MIFITTADVTDRAGALSGLTVYKETLSKVEKVLADGGTGVPFATRIRDILGAEVEIAKRNELHKFEKCCRFWKNCGRTLNSSLNIGRSSLPNPIYQKIMKGF